VLVLSLGVLYTETITRMLPMKAAELIIAMAVVKKIETPLEQDEY
jgi:hypothetical protein